MSEAFICDAIRTPIGRYGGALSTGAPRRPRRRRAARTHAAQRGLDSAAVDDVILGCANQAGEDNRNVARMSALLAGFPWRCRASPSTACAAPGSMPWRALSRMIRTRRGRGRDRRRRREHEPRAVCHVEERHAVCTRRADVSTRPSAGASSMPLLKEAIRRRFDAGDRRERRRGIPGIARRPGPLRAAQPTARAGGRRPPAASPTRSSRSRCRPSAVKPRVVDVDEHPRETSLEALAKLRRRSAPGGTVTAGNASGVNDGACALLLAGTGAIERYGLTPRARIVGTAVAGVEPRIMGMGPSPATRKLLARLGIRPRRHRSHRAQRGVRRAGARGAARAGHRRTMRRM